MLKVLWLIFGLPIKPANARAVSFTKKKSRVIKPSPKIIGFSLFKIRTILRGIISPVL